MLHTLHCCKAFLILQYINREGLGATCPLCSSRGFPNSLAVQVRIKPPCAGNRYEYLGTGGGAVRGKHAIFNLHVNKTSARVISISTSLIYHHASARSFHGER